MLLPFAFGAHYSTPATFAIRALLGVSMKIAVFDGSNARHSVPMLTTGLWHPPVALAPAYPSEADESLILVQFALF